MSDKITKGCKDCGHEKQNHDVLREPYGRLCASCMDEKNMDPCRQYSE